MKATILYCDRCHGEGNGEVRAALVVWIRTSLGGRPIRLDVCNDHFGAIVGQSTNGAAPPPAPSTAAPSHVWSKRGGGGEHQKTYDRLLPFIAKHARFAWEDAETYLGKDTPPPRVRRVLTVLIEQRKLERYAMGIYQRPGYTVPEPATVELAGAAALKLIKAKPGMRVGAIAALAGIESHTLWKATLVYLRGEKLARAKGSKSAMRLYPA
jgi:hypothetical protein